MYPVQYYYVPAQQQYQPQFFQVVIEIMILAALLVSLGGFAVTQVRKVSRGEEIELPSMLRG